MPNKLTDAEIIKALELCKTNVMADCKKCPLRQEDGSMYMYCTSTLVGNALDLINRQEARIHQQEKTIMEIQNANLIDFKGTIANYKAENERLKAEIERLKIENAVIMKQSLAENKTTATAIMAETKQHMMTAEKIKRLKEEIERLNKSINLMKGAKCVYSYDGETLEFCTTSPCPISKTVDQIKTEAYKEFATKTTDKVEKAKQKYERLCKEQGEKMEKHMHIHFNGIIKIVKDLLNELVGGSDGENN